MARSEDALRAGHLPIFYGLILKDRALLLGRFKDQLPGDEILFAAIFFLLDFIIFGNPPNPLFFLHFRLTEFSR